MENRREGGREGGGGREQGESRGREQREGVRKPWCGGGWEREWRKGGKVDEGNE